MEDKPIWETFEMVPCKTLKDDVDVYKFQQYSTYLSLAQDNFVLGLQTGLGKTLVAYLSYYYFKEKFPNTKLIIVSNKSAVLQMEEQLYKFFNVKERGLSIHRYMDRLKKEKYQDTRKRALTDFKGEGNSGGLEIIWMNYPLFMKHRKDFEKILISLKIWGWNIFTIFDESTKFMNMGTQTFRAVRKVSQLSDKVLTLTATLSKGKLEQIYSIFKGINIPLFPRKDEFMSRYCDVWQHPKLHYIKKVRGYRNVQELVDLIRPYIVVFRKADVASQLPPFTIKKTYLEHSEDQIKLISGIYSGDIDVSMYKEQGNSIRERDGSLKKAIETNFIKMVLLDERLIGRKTHIDPSKLSPKTEEIIRMLGEDFLDEKIVIYTHSKVYLKLMAETVRHNEKVPMNYRKVLEIHGDVNSIDREKNKKLFSESKNHNIMMINSAGMESLNLQAANTIIITTLPDSFGGLTQLAGRISRIDTKQKNLFLIYLLMKDSQDEDEYAIIMQQGVLLKNFFDEPEEGLIDYSVLIKNKNISKEEYQSRSLLSLVLKQRKRRAMMYTKKLLRG